ncbi:MAG TPA: hypothetical protein VE093_27735, partial [Polyangiaceae bacterium]|nr:hypothetical protein [Polyangiaceae bacterium]
MTRGFALSGDLSQPFAIAACILAAASAALLVFEVVRSSRTRTPALGIAASGILAVLALLFAVLRPVAILSKGTLVGSKVIVLVDGSRSIDLPGLGGTRRDAAARALADLGKRAAEVRLSMVRFGESGRGAVNVGQPAAQEAAQEANAKTPEGSSAPNADRPQAQGSSFPTSPEDARKLLAGRPFSRSDLAGALESIARAADERPLAIVVLSDGRLDRPGSDAAGDAVRASLGTLEVPVHTVALATAAPADASIRAVKAAGAAVAHQPLSLRIEIGCDGGLECDAMPVVARELREQGDPTLLASGTAHVAEGK